MSQADYDRGLRAAAKFAREAADRVRAVEGWRRTRYYIGAFSALSAFADDIDPASDNAAAVEQPPSPVPSPTRPAAVAALASAALDAREVATVKGYVGDPCPDCGNFTLVRNGTCLKCDTCGATTGCS